MKMSRKERELQFRVNLVLDAAEEVFAECSYVQASIEEIARRAEISVGTLYNLFHSKEDIYRGVLSRSQEAFFKNLERCIEETRGPKDRVHAVIRCSFEHFSKYSRQFRLYVSATNGFQWELKSNLEQDAFETQQKFMRRLVEICQRGMDDGVFKKGLPAELMAVTLLGVPHSFLMIWLEQEGVDMMSLVAPALVVADRVTGADDV